MKVYLVIGIMLSSLFLTTSCVTTNSMGYSILNQDNKGIVNDNDFSVMYQNAFTIQYDAEGSCLIRNNKDSTLFIDMAQSFWLNNEGISSPLYNNTVTTTTSSSTSGTGVNLGGIARVLGAGPITQTLANSTVVTRSSTNGVTIMKYEDRYVAIPPFSSAYISFQTLGLNDPFKERCGNLPYDRPSESQILSYTYSSDNPNWTMVRNQFVLNCIRVKKTNKSYGERSLDWGKFYGILIIPSDKKNEVVYGKTNGCGKFVAFSSMFLATIAIVGSFVLGVESLSY